ncbi:methionine synthase [Allosalinactinospora lopnorensis]|uniref:methionine synthase n=1 Tax=Allosalinactinospora lopnorensis TaxID=1352348 RepID=UPI000623BA9B|nr:methionine synthase [Allosalinactinospora lopnorensis]
MSEQRYPWPEASSTGVGSYPGEDPDEVARTILGELPDLPHLAELPGRGAGADMIGRSAALLVDFPVEVQPTGWRVVQRPGRDLARAASFLSYDLDALEKHAHAYEGPLKIQVVGPWTLAAGIELRSGERLLADSGAVADLCESLVEGVCAHIEDVRRRVPRGRILVQADEPSLPAALQGGVPTVSGYGRLRAINRVTCEERMRALFGAIADTGAFPMAHCCAPAAPVDLLRRSGARALALDATLLTPDSDEALGVAVEDGLGLFLGVVAGTDTPLSDPATTVEPVRELWNRIGFAPEQLARTVVTTPTCGLAGASPDHARAALAACRKAARVLREEPRR